MSRSTKIIIILAIISVVLLIAGFVVSNLSTNAPMDTVTTNINTSDTVQDVDSSNNTGNNTVTTNVNTSNQRDDSGSVADDGIMPLGLAQLFTERYGSYSTDTDYANILDLTIFMSESYAAIQEGYVEEQRLKSLGIDEPFYGVTTRSLSYERLIEEDDFAKYRISTRRTERKGASDPEIFNQDIIIELIVEDSSWKVDSATWQ